MSLVARQDIWLGISRVSLSGKKLSGTCKWQQMLLPVISPPTYCVVNVTVMKFKAFTTNGKWNHIKLEIMLYSGHECH